MGNCLSGMVAMDIFGKKAELRLPSGSTKYKTMIGCCCTILYLLVIVLFCLMKGQEYSSKMQLMTSVSSTIEQEYYDMDKSVEMDPRVQIAYGLIDPLNPNDPVTTPKLVNIVARIRSWNFIPADGEEAAGVN